MATPTYTFDMVLLSRRLAKLSVRSRTAFCLSVAERLFGNYAYFSNHHDWGEPSVLRTALDLAWSFVAGEEVKEKELARHRALVDAETPDTEDFDVIHVSFALDAANAVAQSLGVALGENGTTAAEVGSFARDTVDMFIQERDDLSLDDSNLEERIRLDDLMQKELRQKADDLELLEGEQEPSGFVAIWRARYAGRPSNIGLS